MSKLFFILALALGLIATAAATSISNTAARDILEGEKCDYDPKWCKKGLRCVGPVGRKRCYARVQEGGLCKRPYFICDKGLRCKRTKCEKILLPEGASCNRSFDMCRPPLSCVGDPGYKECHLKGDIGDSCGNEPFWVCKDHLVCKNGTCFAH